MLKKSKFFLGAFLFSIAVLLLLFFNNFLSHGFLGNRIVKIKIGEKIFRAERVSDVLKLQKGLGKRVWICDDCGMFFDFEQQGKHSFWMKDMNFSLDMIWILDDRVVWIEKNVSHKDQERIYFPPVDSGGVLEIKAGLAAKNNIKLNDKIEFR